MSRSTISTFQLFEMFPDEASARQYLAKWDLRNSRPKTRSTMSVVGVSGAIIGAFAPCGFGWSRYEIRCAQGSRGAPEERAIGTRQDGRCRANVPPEKQGEKAPSEKTEEGQVTL